MGMTFNLKKKRKLPNEIIAVIIILIASLIMARLYGVDVLVQIFLAVIIIAALFYIGAVVGFKQAIKNIKRLFTP